MKQLTIILIGLISVAYGQSSPTSSKTRFVNGLYVGTKLDSYFAAADSNAIYWRADSALMAKYKGTARRVLFVSDSATYLNQVVRTFGTQTVGGNKTFSNDIVVNGGLSIGRGNNSLQNVRVGGLSLISVTTGTSNTAVGDGALSAITTGTNNSGLGASSLLQATSGLRNIGIGDNTLRNITTTSDNTAIGYEAGRYIAALGSNTGASNGIYIGSGSAALAASGTNETVIGYNTIGNGSNTVTIGNSSVTGNFFNGFLKQTSVTSSVLKADGSGVVSAAVAGTDYVAPSALSGYLPLSGGTLTGALNGTTASFTSTAYGTVGSFLDASVSGIKLVANALSGFNKIISDGNQPLIFDLNGGERLRFEASGENAILAKGYKIDGDNSFFFNAITSGANQQIRYRNNGTDKWQIYLKTSDNSLNFYSSANSADRVTIAESGALSGTSLSMSGGGSFGGNVGIGTPSPAVALDLGSSTGRGINLYTSGSDYYGINMATYDGGSFSTNIFSGDGGLIKFRTASGTTTHSTRMTITALGDVLINTTTTDGTNKLIVNGGLKSTDATITSLAGTGDRLVQANSSGQLSATQAIASGTYTPTFTNTTNITSNADDGVAFYSRVGNIVTVTVRRLVTPTTASANTELTFTLPIAAASTPSGIGHGIYYQGGGTQNAVGAVFMSSATEAKFQFTCPSGAAGLQNRTIFSFQYQVN